ncbi:inositol phosphate phosphatase SopB, partial [Salmonella enterica]
MSLFCGIRHGVISNYHLNYPLMLLFLAEKKAIEVLTAELYSKP